MYEVSLPSWASESHSGGSEDSYKNLCENLEVEESQDNMSEHHGLKGEAPIKRPCRGRPRGP